MVFDFLGTSSIALEEHIGHASLALFEDNVLELLYIPACSREDLEAVGQDSDLVKVTHLHFAHLSVSNHGGVDPVVLVDNAL